MKRNATFSVNLEPELNERLRRASDESGVAISAIARASIMAAIEFYEEHGFFTMPVKFKSFTLSEKGGGVPHLYSKAAEYPPDYKGSE